jgi:hypothetical protein
VLERNHDLAGPAGRTIGGHARTEARRTARLFLPAKAARRLSPAVRSDRVCAELLKLDWLEDKGAQRRKIIDEHLAHLVGLLDDGLITLSDLRHLLYLSMTRVRHHVLRYRRSLETEEERLAREQCEAEWREKAIALYRERPRDEAPRAFFNRIVIEERYPFNWGVLLASLTYAGLLPAQVARRQKKRMSGKSEKSKNPESRSGKSAVTGRNPAASEGSETHENGL